MNAVIKNFTVTESKDSATLNGLLTFVPLKTYARNQLETKNFYALCIVKIVNQVCVRGVRVSK